MQRAVHEFEELIRQTKWNVNVLVLVNVNVNVLVPVNVNVLLACREVQCELLEWDRSCVP